MLININEIDQFINSPYPFMAAGSKETLEKIPPGNWIGGTVPFLIENRGDALKEDMMEVTPIPSSVSAVRIKSYGLQDIHTICQNGFPGGFSLIIVPAESKVHHSLALNCRDYPQSDTVSQVGWVAGYPESEDQAYGVFGPKGKFHHDRLVVMHCKLREGYKAVTELINIFEPGEGPILEFIQSGFEIEKVKVEGEIISFPQYIKKNEVDTTLPLISLDEENSNVSFQKVDHSQVSMYAPVFKHNRYRLAKSIEDYHASLMERVEQLNLPSYFNCNCILNYRNDGLVGKDMGEISGPVTFGEFANHLLNQTFVSLAIVKDS